MSVPGATADKGDHVFDGGHSFFLQALDKYTLLNVLANVEVRLAGVEEVGDALVINLEVGAFNEVFCFGLGCFGFLLVSFDARKNVFKTALHEPTLFVSGAGRVLCANNLVLVVDVCPWALDSVSFS